MAACRLADTEATPVGMMGMMEMFEGETRSLVEKRAGSNSVEIVNFFRLKVGSQRR